MNDAWLPLLDYPILDFPTSGYPTSENPMQLNKDILTTEKSNTDLIKYLFLSYPFPLSLGAKYSGRAAGTEKNGTGAAIQKILFVMLRSRTPFLRVDI